MYRGMSGRSSDIVLYKYRLYFEYSYRGICSSDSVTLQASDEKAAVRKLTARLHKTYGNAFCIKIRRISKL